MKKSTINSLVRIAKRKISEQSLTLEGNKSRFLWSIVIHPVDLSESAIKLLTEVRDGVYDKNK